MRNVHRQQVCLEHGAATATATARVAVAVSAGVGVSVIDAVHIAFTANFAVAAVAAKASNSLTVRCLALTYLRTRFTAISLMANP